jgi:hypothetical protein
VPDLAAASDTGVAIDDNITTLTNADAGNVLLFEVGSTTAGATVTLYADGVAIGSALADSDTTIVTTDGVSALADGSHLITARQTEPGKGASAESPSLAVTIDTTPPAVVAVRVFGAAWPDDPATPETPFAIPVGSGNQLIGLTWPGIDQVQIQFSEDVAVTQQDLTLTGHNVAAYTITQFDYDTATRTATWMLAVPIADDDLTAVLGDTVFDPVSLALDGDWQNPVDINDPSSDVFPSGDGVAGGDFFFDFRVEPDLSGLVNLDVDGNGDANALTDGILIVRFLFGLTGADLIGGNVLADDATRTTAGEIESFLADLLPIAAATAVASAQLPSNLFAPQTTQPNLVAQWVQAERDTATVQTDPLAPFDFGEDEFGYVPLVIV